MVRRDFLVGIGLWLLAACGKTDIVAGMEKLADRTCACTTPACVEKVERTYHHERVADTRGLPPDEVDALHAANQRRSECRNRILTGHAP